LIILFPITTKIIIIKNCLSIPIKSKISKSGLKVIIIIPIDVKKANIKELNEICLNDSQFLSKNASPRYFLIPTPISKFEIVVNIIENEVTAITTPIISEPEKLATKIQKIKVNPAGIIDDRKKAAMFLSIDSSNLSLVMISR